MNEQLHDGSGALDLGGVVAAVGGISAATGSKRPLAAFQIVERKGYDRPFWNRIGSAFVNRDGSINVFLDSVPLQGKIQLREDTPKDKERGERDRGEARQPHDDRQSGAE